MTEIKTGWHKVTSEMDAFFAHSAGNENAPAIILIQEIFGVNDAMQAACHAFAEMGYHAICPDLFHALGDKINITDKSEAEWTEAFGYYQKFNVAEGVKDIQKTIDFARQNAPKVGAVGYCLGGTLAYLTAAQTDIDAAVGYYGIDIQNQLDQAKSIKNPLILHIAGKDEYVPEEAQSQIIEYFKESVLVKTYLYEGVDHAFARVNGVTFNDAAADAANKRTEEFFKIYLG